METYWSVPGVLIASPIDAASTEAFNRHYLIASPLWNNVIWPLSWTWLYSIGSVEQLVPQVEDGVRKKVKSEGTGVERMWRARVSCFFPTKVIGGAIVWVDDLDFPVYNPTLDLLLFGTLSMRYKGSSIVVLFVGGGTNNAWEEILLCEASERQRLHFEEVSRNLLGKRKVGDKIPWQRISKQEHWGFFKGFGPSKAIEVLSVSGKYRKEVRVIIFLIWIRQELEKDMFTGARNKVKKFWISRAWLQVVKLKGKSRVSDYLVHRAKAADRTHTLHI